MLGATAIIAAFLRPIPAASTLVIAIRPAASSTPLKLGPFFVSGDARLNIKRSLL